MSTDRERPILRMPSSTPDWIRQYKANQSQLEAAYETASQTVQLAAIKVRDLRAQRIELLSHASIAVAGSARTAKELQVLAVQARIVAACEAFDEAFRIAEDLRQEVMGTA